MTRILIAVVLTLLLLGPAQCAMDLVHGSDNQGDVTIGFYHPTGSGSQNSVREFDGRNLAFGAVEDVNMLGYSGPWQYGLFGRYLFNHDDDIGFGLNYRNLWGMTIYQSMLTHRFAAFPLSDPALIGTPAAGVVPLVNVSPASQLQIDRNVDNFNFRTTPDKGQSIRLWVNSWLQSKEGTRQQLFRARQAVPGLIANSARGVVTLPVDSNTSETSLGTDLRIGHDTVANYYYLNTHFGEGESSVAGTPLNFSPLNILTHVDSNTKKSVYKMRTTITDCLYFTGVHTTTQRNDTRASLVSPTAMGIDSTNAALTYLAGDSLTLTARYRSLDQSPKDALLGSGSSSNRSLGYSTKSSSIEASFTGVPHAFLKMGYEHLTVERQNVNGEPELAIIQLNSNTNIVTGGLRYYPMQQLSIYANAELSSGGEAGFAGTANEHQKVNANATYMMGDHAALFADYNQYNERNNQVRVPWDAIPIAGLTPTDTALRELAAGQGYHNNMSTSTLGAWYAFNSKLVLDANYAVIQNNAANLWIIGTGAPVNVTDITQYEALSNQWSTGLTYSLTPKWRLYGRYLLTKSDGRSIINPARFPSGIGPTWIPVSVRNQVYTVGFAHDVSLKDSVSLDYSFENWTDAIDQSNSGIFDIWRLAWSRQF
jgi:hypothetical protein